MTVCVDFALPWQLSGSIHILLQEMRLGIEVDLKPGFKQAEA
jgi:hypothetical protein